jgi:hypothetical protein
MSTSKITPKNLSYDTTLPPFLARLHSQNPSTSLHEYTIARPKKSRTAEDIADDEPVYFNEDTGETLTKGEWDARENDQETSNGGEEDKEGKNEGEKEGGVIRAKEEKSATIGISKKRKVGKVIGGSEDEGEAYEKAKKHITLKSSKSSDKPGKVEEKKEVGPKKPAVGKKKGKKVKLSFGDDE